MFDKKLSEIETYKQELNRLYSKVDSAPSGYWNRLSDYTAKMSPDQQAFVNSDETVISAKGAMFEAFSLYLFEKFKDDFCNIDNFKTLCDNYVDSVIKAGSSYEGHVTQTLDENKKLKQRIAELERKLNNNGKSNPNRT